MIRILPVIFCCSKVLSSTVNISTTQVRLNYQKMGKPSSKTLADFGYSFNENGIMKKINPETGKPGNEGFEFETQEHYDALGEVITDHVYELLIEHGLHKIYVPDDIPKDQATFIFATANALKNPKKLMVLIHGSGVVRAGQWARSLIINHSMDHGSQIPYIKKAQSLGYEVIITNTNDNYRIIDGVRGKIKNNASPTEHGCSVWEKYIIKSNPDSVCIVAHSYGGVVTMDLVKKYSDFVRDKVFAIGLTDSVHSTGGLNKENRQMLKSICRNWVTSSKPLDYLIDDDQIPSYSAGHTKHEWTSYSCMEALFKFFEEKHEQFNAKGENKAKSEL